MSDGSESSLAPPGGGEAACREHPDRDAPGVCNECQAPLCEECQVSLGENVYCQACVERSRVSLRQAMAAITCDPDYNGALGWGLLTAMLCAWGWGLITNALHMRIGLLAIGVGYLVGQAVVRGAGDKRGRGLQVLGLVLSVMGILGGLFVEAYYDVAAYLARYPGMGRPGLAAAARVFPAHLQGTGLMTWIIVACGVWQGWMTPKAPDLDVYGGVSVPPRAEIGRMGD